MRDPRIDRLAHVLVEYSTEVKPGQIVRISGDPVAMPLLEAVYERVLAAGAHPHVKCVPDTMQEIFLERASHAQLDYVSPLLEHEVRHIDVSIGVWAETNTKHLSRVDPERQGRASAARKPIFKVFMERAATKELRWSGTLYPTAASAQDAEMSLRQYEDFVFSAGHLDAGDPVGQWRWIEARQQKVVGLPGRQEGRSFPDGRGDGPDGQRRGDEVGELLRARELPRRGGVYRAEPQRARRRG